MKDRQITDDVGDAGTHTKPALKPYTPPRILSVEPLEAVAATCDGTGGYGKSTRHATPRLEALESQWTGLGKMLDALADVERASSNWPVAVTGSAT